MSSRWEDTPLGNIATPISRPVDVVPGNSYRTIGVKWWGEGAYERQTIDGSYTAAKKLSLVREGDLIINKIWVRHGSTAIASDAVDGCAASGEFPTFVLDERKVLPRWIHWQTKTRNFWTKCDALSRGTSGKNRIKPQLFLTIRLPLPPLSEQRRIVDRIDRVAAKIYEAKATQEDIQTTALGMLRATFSRVVDGAKWLSISEIAPLTRRPVTVQIEGEYPELGVRSFGKGTFHKPILLGSELTWQKLFRIRAGDIVFSNIKAWEGAVAVAGPNDDARVGSHRYLTCVPVSGKATANFVSFFLLSRQGLAELGKASPGSADRNRTLGQKALQRITVPVPSYEEQLWFDSLHAQVEELKTLQAKSTVELDALLPSILDKAFKGEL